MLTPPLGASLRALNNSHVIHIGARPVATECPTPFDAVHFGSESRSSGRQLGSLAMSVVASEKPAVPDVGGLASIFRQARLVPSRGWCGYARGRCGPMAVQ